MVEGDIGGPTFAQRWSGFVKRNIVALVMIPVLISVHVGWSALQNVEQFVPKAEKKELPIVEVS